LTEKIGLREKLVPVRVESLNDIVRMAASIAMLGQSTYIVRVKMGGGRRLYGLVALLRDYYDLYGLPLLYYTIVEDGGENDDKHFVLFKVDEQGEHVELSRGMRTGWVSIPIIDLAELPSFFPRLEEGGH